MLVDDDSADLGRASLVQHLAWAERQVAEAASCVARQRGLIEALAARSSDTRPAEELLATMEAVLRVAQAYRASVRREMGLRQAKKRSVAMPAATGSRTA
jgi:hypothetical protein